MRVWVGWLNDLSYYAWEGSSVLWKCKHEASADLPKLSVLTCSCLACPLVGVGPYEWRCSLMESPCVVSLIVVGSFTLLTVGCACIVNWVLCLLREILSQMYTGLQAKYPLLLWDFNGTWIWWTVFFFPKIVKYQTLYKSVQCEPSCSMRTTDGRTDGRTDRTTYMTKLIPVFSQFANAPTNYSLYPCVPLRYDTKWNGFSSSVNVGHRPFFLHLFFYL